MSLTNGSRSFARMESFDWMDDAACKGNDKYTATYLHLVTKERLAMACLECPVLQQCREYRQHLEANGKTPEGVILAGKIC